jgi:hypothetical protein
MLLGLPYGFNDAHYGPMDALLQSMGTPEHRFVQRCAVVGGKLIDRNTLPGDPSFAVTMALDEEMEAIAASMPSSWWQIPEALPNTEHGIDQLRDRLLQQYYFFHLRINLHIPFMASHSAGTRLEICRSTGVEASRQLLHRFILLRAQFHGNSVFDCKTSDFVAFMAAVVLILGVSVPVQLKLNDWVVMNPRDRQTLADARSVFHREETEKECRIASQCGKMLDMLTADSPWTASNSSTKPQLPETIFVPFFGTLVRKPAVSLSATAAGVASEQAATEAATTSNETIVALEDSIGEASVCLSTNWALETSINPLFDDLSTWLDSTMGESDASWNLVNPPL